MHRDTPQPKKQKHIHRFTGNLTRAYTETAAQHGDDEQGESLTRLEDELRKVHNGAQPRVVLASARHEHLSERKPHSTYTRFASADKPKTEAKDRLDLSSCCVK
jgi:hypothetical protein